MTDGAGKWEYTGVEQSVEPTSRTRGLIVQELGDETLVYDLERDRAHCLNPAAACVWRHADGTRSVAALTQLLHTELALPQDPAIVWSALRQLDRGHLLEQPATPPSEYRFSRRDLARHLRLVGAGTLLLPAVLSIVAPEAASAGSYVSSAQCGDTKQNYVGWCCTNKKKCASNKKCVGSGC